MKSGTPLISLQLGLSHFDPQQLRCLPQKPRCSQQHMLYSEAFKRSFVTLFGPCLEAPHHRGWSKGSQTLTESWVITTTPLMIHLFIFGPHVSRIITPRLFCWHNFYLSSLRPAHLICRFKRWFQGWSWSFHPPWNRQSKSRKILQGELSVVPAFWTPSSYYSTNYHGIYLFHCFNYFSCDPSYLGFTSKKLYS